MTAIGHTYPFAFESSMLVVLGKGVSLYDMVSCWWEGEQEAARRSTVITTPQCILSVLVLFLCCCIIISIVVGVVSDSSVEEEGRVAGTVNSIGWIHDHNR